MEREEEREERERRRKWEDDSTYLGSVRESSCSDEQVLSGLEWCSVVLSGACGGPEWKGSANLGVASAAWDT